MKRPAKLLPAKATDLSGKGLARIQIESHPRQGLELWGPLPGEEVEVQLGSRRNLWLQQVLVPHPHRREPECLHYGLCGGCSLQHLEYAAQLKIKSESLYRSLGRVAPQAELLPPLPSPQIYHYRTKVEFSFHREWVGFHRRGCFDRVVDIDHCWIAPGIHREALQRTRQWARSEGWTGWDARRFVGDLRYLMIRQSNPQPNPWLAVLVTRPELPLDSLRQWQEALLPLKPRGLIWVEQESPGGAIVPLRQHLLWGENCLEQSLGDLTFRLTWRSFFQTNPPAYLKLLEQLRNWLGSPSSLLDLYCGIGSIGLFASDPKCHLVGVESVPEAIEDARRCARELGRNHAEFHCLASEEWEDFSFEAAVIDPPRSGCHPKLIEKLARQGPKNLFYVSCNPQRFVQELSQLSSSYRLERAQACDFFPQTAHLELLAWLRRL